MRLACESSDDADASIINRPLPSPAARFNRLPYLTEIYSTRVAVVDFCKTIQTAGPRRGRQGPPSPLFSPRGKAKRARRPGSGGSRRGCLDPRSACSRRPSQNLLLRSAQGRPSSLFRRGRPRTSRLAEAGLRFRRIRSGARFEQMRGGVKHAAVSAANGSTQTMALISIPGLLDDRLRGRMSDSSWKVATLQSEPLGSE